MITTRRSTGDEGEDIAVAYLKKQKYAIRERNFRTRFGEIDIVAEKDGLFIFVEVKTKTSALFGTPEEEFTTAKQKRMRRAIVSYIYEKKIYDARWRVELVAIEIKKDGSYEIRHHKETPFKYS
ncbi:MAG: YraN family protein [Parcubacteria group bacterium]|nr:YraN family protein [Parcubacteria group bacterium]